MKTLIILLLLTLSIDTFSQYGITYTDVIILPEKKKDRLINRYDYHGYRIEFYQCDSINYCSELEEYDDQFKVQGIFFYKHLIPRSYRKYIWRFDILPIKLKRGGRRKKFN